MKPKKKDIQKNKKTGFAIPDNYLSEFENDFQENASRLDSGYTSPKDYFKTLDDKLIASVNNTGFRTPDNYFQSIDNKILNKIKKNKNSRVISLVKSSYFKVIGYSVAASLLLFVGFNNLKNDDNSVNFEALEITEIENWVDDDLITFNSFDIAEVFDDDAIYLSSEFTYSDDDIIDYLGDINIENLTIED